MLVAGSSGRIDGRVEEGESLSSHAYRQSVGSPLSGNAGIVKPVY